MVKPKDDDDKGPLLGGLLRMAHQAVVAHIAAGFEAAGLPPHQPAVTQQLWDRPDGMRLTELAAGAGMTKQSMGELVDQMEASGYVERVQDPTDRRARLVRLTPRGREMARLARQRVREIKEHWGQRVGPEAIQSLEATLRLIVG